MRYHIEKNSIQETLVIPLYGRALCSRKFPRLFADQAAAELLFLGVRGQELQDRIGRLEGGES